MRQVPDRSAVRERNPFVSNAAVAQAITCLEGLAAAQAAPSGQALTVAQATQAQGTGQNLYTLDNGYIKVTVSGENGGFVILDPGRRQAEQGRQQ
jgi:expansin (peptidoglycan-binding protein)